MRHCSKILVAAAMIPLGVLAIALVPAPAQAQSDGTLEDAYARDCGQHGDNQVCNALRDAMTHAASRPALPKPTNAEANPSDLSRVWGDYANLAGTTWRDQTGTFFHYRWDIKGEVLLVDVVAANAIWLTTLSRTSNDRIEGLYPDGSRSTFEFPRSGVAVQTGSNGKTTYRLTNERISLINTSANGTETRERRRATTAEFEAAKTAAAAVRSNELAGSRLLRSGEPMAATTDGNDRGTHVIWRVPCFRLDALPGDIIQIDSNVFGKRAILGFGDTDCKTPFNAEANFDNAGARSNARLIIKQGTSPVYVKLWLRGKGKKYELTPQKLTQAEFAEREAEREAEQRQAALARQQAEASSGNNGLFGALAMATGAALAGGNAEVVMGAAMKGAELTTDNEGTRRMLAGEGDQMIASGIDSMQFERTLRSPAATGQAASGRLSATGSAGQAGFGSAAQMNPNNTDRPGFYACNSYNVTTRVLYFSPIVVRPYDDPSWRSRLASDFAQFVAAGFPGEYHGGGAVCWSRRTEAETQDAISSSKRSTASMNQSWRDVIDWIAPE